MKKSLIVFLTSLAIMPVWNVSPTRAEQFSYSDSNKYTNINGNFSVSNVYHYSSDDKTSVTHKAVFVLDSNQVTVDGETLIINAVPYINNGRTMIPLRAVTDIFGNFKNSLGIGWNSAEKKITVLCDGNEIVFTAGSSEYTVNGEKKTAPGNAAEIKNGVTYIPVRLMADTLDLNTNWDGGSKTITITN